MEKETTSSTVQCEGYSVPAVGLTCPRVRGSEESNLPLVRVACWEQHVQIARIQLRSVAHDAFNLHRVIKKKNEDVAYRGQD